MMNTITSKCIFCKKYIKTVEKATSLVGQGKFKYHAYFWITQSITTICIIFWFLEYNLNQIVYYTDMSSENNEEKTIILLQ